ncbi:hypothetical protein DQ04_00351020 [Trypanosoma grayi]|uniref:hypothetical protein n=1 Tax=Trypanosoma grayi TaxID=71804 RepID=UPI0004F45213|nr:hypothetical protein DQ04_00351020 [Trypanosoma grayi]KEG14665.1 hypothetical protein DQ04_00351020 [Trypanosoma grayi]
MVSVSERLVLQLVKMHQREAELEREKLTLHEKDELKARLQERLAQTQEQVRKVESIRTTLEGLNRAAEEGYEQARRDDEAEREKLSEKLRVTIDAVNNYSEEVVQLDAKAQQENKSLKEQLEIYAKYHATGQDKYQEIMKAREAEYAKIAAKRDAEVARQPQLESELEVESRGLEEARKEHAELQEQVNVWLDRMTEIQQRLLKAKGSFESSRDERERQVRRIRSLESDRQLMVSRAEKSKALRDNEHAKVLALESKVEEYKKHTEKLLAVVAMLDGAGDTGRGAGENC